MRKFRHLPALALLLSLSFAAPEPAAADSRNRHWTLLGTLQVADRVDRDVLRLQKRKGTFDAIVLRVRQHAVQFRSLEIHFENNSVQKVPMHTVIRAGKRSQVIDLKGGQRAIKKIVFVYDAQTWRRGQGAEVQVLGRR